MGPPWVQDALIDQGHQEPVDALVAVLGGEICDALLKVTHF